MKRRLALLLILIVLGLVLGPLKLNAHNGPKFDPNAGKPMLANEVPGELKDIGITEKLGQNIDPSLRFVDEQGRQVRLGDYFNSGRPVLLSIVYYGCPSLCSFHLNGLTAGLKTLNWTPGEQFEIVTVSMDSSETPELAAKKKAAYLKEYGRPEAAVGWHFLTGTEDQIQALAAQVGFSFRWDEPTKQFAHASAAYVLTPQGKIARYLYGIQFESQTIKLSLLEASNGVVGNLMEKFIMYCFHFDPNQNKYTLYAFNLMKIVGSLFAVALAIVLVPLWVRESRSKLGTT